MGYRWLWTGNWDCPESWLSQTVGTRRKKEALGMGSRAQQAERVGAQPRTGVLGKTLSREWGSGTWSDMSPMTRSPMSLQGSRYL